MVQLLGLGPMAWFYPTNCALSARAYLGEGRTRADDDKKSTAPAPIGSVHERCSVHPLTVGTSLYAKPKAPQVELAHSLHRFSLQNFKVKPLLMGLVLQGDPLTPWFEVT